jgi:hypothetical protein
MMAGQLPHRKIGHRGALGAAEGGMAGLSGFLI